MQTVYFFLSLNLKNHFDLRCYRLQINKILCKFFNYWRGEFPPSKTNGETATFGLISTGKKLVKRSTHQRERRRYVSPIQFPVVKVKQL
jgi:hypothetical protein